ncbi:MULTISPECIES: GTPase [Limnochorda]|uniref:GTPase n=1 Tax=Limnochorda TaxID=1676651 RepID=UPI001D3C653F|nr:GTPase [Limnochorda pilosa]MBO2487006.1 ribosome biogenesis GTPase YlqF [Bacillota bacterium]MBO2518192.1 ribosome biogenesis GTPase YlqF [Bacillota bacterium]
MEIRWQPGHLVRARRELRLLLSQAQWVLEVCDARAPQASRERRLAELVPPERRILVLSHGDLADPALTRRWVDHFRAQGEQVQVVRLDRPTSYQGIRRRLTPPRPRQDAALRGIRLGAHVTVQRAVVVGLPNVGKSTLINVLARRTRARTEARAGTTRGPQWIRVSEGLEILDTPGILAPAGIRGERAYLLAALGLVSDRSFPVWEVAVWLVTRLGLAGPERDEAEEALERMGRRWGLVAKGGGIHAEQTALRLLQQFRRGRLGRLTLERPEPPQPEPAASG